MCRRKCIVLLSCLAWVGSVSAEPPCQAPRPFWHNWLHGASVCPSLGCCPDDYERKPVPAICSIPHYCGVDDYCPTPNPCIVAHPRCGSPDDYGCKPQPTLLCPPCSGSLRCGPSPIHCLPSTRP